jgi:hypothetical protein
MKAVAPRNLGKYSGLFLHKFQNAIPYLFGAFKHSLHDNEGNPKTVTRKLHHASG